VISDVNACEYFTSVVSDKECSREAVLSELHSQLTAADSSFTVVASYTAHDSMIILTKVTKTAALSDNIPYWL